MKYMGSKRAMLLNGLGQVIRDEAAGAKRFVDLFSGSGMVSWFAGQNTSLPVVAVDLQLYAVVLARSVLARTSMLSAPKLERDWIAKAKARRSHISAWRRAQKVDTAGKSTRQWARKARELCGSLELALGPVWSAYGGYYFSPSQALTLDCLLASIPKEEPARSVCLAAAIVSASECAGSPGHTAQPFRPTPTAGPFLRKAWERNPLQYAAKALRRICPRHAAIKGRAVVADAVVWAKELVDTDLVFIDPPYSAVHYSRFYHVLETIARGRCSAVEGAGRYPPFCERPASSFSRKSESHPALQELFAHLRSAGCAAILTFPAGMCSNGLSGELVVEAARRHFRVEETLIKGTFSTLGGNNAHRAARRNARELLLVLRPS